jgi:microsomal dipeptidase-like Zn-dependent dipeptidase
MTRQVRQRARTLLIAGLPDRRLALAMAAALTLGVLAPADVAGREVKGADTTGPASLTASDPFEGAEQAPACGGLGQRACCFTEVGFDPACQQGLKPVPMGDYPLACGGFGAATCVPVTPATACGGEGQRACCIGEGDRCQPGLEYIGIDTIAPPFVPVSGDASCRNQVIDGSGVARSQGMCSASAPPHITEPTSGWSPATGARGILRGYHDMHLHLLGNMAHGGRNLVGEPAPVLADGSYGLDATHDVNSALSPATDLLVHRNPFHGLFFDTSGEGTKDGARSMFGAPYFTGWPKWTSTTHQQTYYVWLERAWRGGLRATTLFASHVESLCKTSLKDTKESSWPLCENSMLHVVNQLKAALKFEAFVDTMSGGPGLGWFRIVRTPQEARAAVRAGKLAVVLGIEVDNLFNCKEAGCPADFGLPTELTGRPAPTTLVEAVNVIYDMGVRHVFPIHNFDNAFGGAATWMDPIGVGQAVAEGRWWVLRNCGNGVGDYGFWVDNALEFLMSVLGFGIGIVPPLPPYINGNLDTAYASCNQYGLNTLGPLLLHTLMDKGMLIDIDHMGALSLDQTIAITAAGPAGNGLPYPLLASHVQAFDLHQKEFRDNKGRHERMRTPAQLAAIRDSGGLVAAMLKDDVQDTDLKGEKYNFGYVPAVGATVTDNCRHSSKTWAQLLQYTVDVMGGPVSMGSDWNGAAGHVGPRFGSDACGGWGTPNGFERPRQEVENNRVQYPFTLPGFGTFDQQVTGFKAFDYNVDGLAHIGLVPDMVADLERIGVDAHYIDALFCSAEAYIRVWERADALGAGLAPPDPNRAWLCRSTDSTAPESTVALSPDANAAGWHKTDVTATITAIDADSGVERIDHALTFAGQTGNGFANGAVATRSVTGEGTSSLAYFATDNAGNVEPSKTATVLIDKTAPTIAASRTPANAAGWNNTAVTVNFTCADALSGVASCTQPQTLSAEGASQSSSGEAVDNAGNTATTSLSGIDIDLTAPAVAIAGIADGATYDLGSVPQAGCTTSDALSGVATSAVVSVTGGTSNNVGTFAVACNGASDKAGNTGSASASYTVHYIFTGFFAPVNNLPVVNTVKAGQTVPVKFSLGGNHGLDVLQGGAATSVLISCSAGAVLDPVELTIDTPGANQFAYDPLTDRYQFNWKTDKAWANGCRRLLVRLDDGSVHTADFRLQ